MGLCKSKDHRRLTPIQRQASAAAKDAVIDYRKAVKQRLLPSTLKMLRTDFKCEFVIEPWKTRSDVDVGDIFFDSFAKSVDEINVAMKGGIYTRDGYEFKYSRSIVLCLRNLKTANVASAVLFVVHGTDGGDILEVIWLATRQKKEGKGLGSVLFRRVAAVASVLRCRAILVTATSNVVFWWCAQAGRGIKSCKLHPILIRSDGSSSAFKKDLPPAHKASINKMPSYSVKASPGGEISRFYAPNKTFRYTYSTTTHIWFLMASQSTHSSASKNAKKSSSASKAKGKRGSGKRKGGR